MKTRGHVLAPARGGFTLLEVMIAVALFFMAAFSILALVSQNLRAARSLQTSHVSASMVASQLALTNRLEEGPLEGTFEDIFPGLYPGFTWAGEVVMVSSNGLFQVDLVVFDGGRQESAMSILLHKPESVTGTGGGLRTRTR